MRDCAFFLSEEESGLIKEDHKSEGTIPALLTANRSLNLQGILFLL